MVKNILLLIVLSLLLSSSKAQDSTDLFLTNIKISSNNSFNSSNQYRKLFGYGLTIGIDIKTKNLFQPKVSIGYFNSSRYVDSMSVKYGYYYEMLYKHHWLTLNMEMKFFLNSKKQFYFGTGLNMEVLVRTKTYGFHHTTNISHFGYQTRDTYVEEIVETYGVNLIIPMEIGFRIPLGNTFLTLFVNYNLGLNHLKEFVNDEELQFKNSYFESGIEFSF